MKKKKSQPTRDGDALPGPGCLMTRRQITDFLHPLVKQTAIENDRNRIDQRVREAIKNGQLTPIEEKPELVFLYEDMFRWAVNMKFHRNPKAWKTDWWCSLPAGIGRRVESVLHDRAYFQEPTTEVTYIPADTEQRAQLLREYQETCHGLTRQPPKRGRPRK